jgi:hypothetical protein
VRPQVEGGPAAGQALDERRVPGRVVGVERAGLEQRDSRGAGAGPPATARRRRAGGGARRSPRPRPTGRERTRLGRRALPSDEAPASAASVSRASRPPGRADGSSSIRLPMVIRSALSCPARHMMASIDVSRSSMGAPWASLPSTILAIRRGRGNRAAGRVRVPAAWHPVSVGPPAGEAPRPTGGVTDDRDQGCSPTTGRRYGPDRTTPTAWSSSSPCPSRRQRSTVGLSTWTRSTPRSGRSSSSTRPS